MNTASKPTQPTASTMPPAEPSAASATVPASPKPSPALMVMGRGADPGEVMRAVAAALAASGSSVTSSAGACVTPAAALPRHAYTLTAGTPGALTAAYHTLVAPAG